MGSARFNAMAYKTGGIAWVWGCSSYGQLGTGETASYSSPVATIGAHSFIIINSGLSNSIGLKQDGSAWCWGEGTYGNCGDGTNANKSSPVAVIGNHSFIDAIVGARNCFGLKSDGSVWGWGNNTLGALGNGDVSSYSSPVSVIGNHAFIQMISGGTTASCTTIGLKADGSAWSWGGNAYGQCGNNTRTNVSSPVAVVGDHSFINARFGTFCSFFLKANGEVWSCGANSFGELGNGDRTSYSSPVLVVGSHAFVQITCTALNTELITVAGLKSDGSVWCWGHGTAIGNLTTTSYSSPVAVLGNHSFIQIEGGAGPWMSGLKSNGEVWSWGGNTYGQLGDGSTTAKSSPVLVVGNHSFLSLHAGMNVSLNAAGVWKRQPIMFINKDGVWDRVNNINLNISGAWKQVRNFK